MKIQYTDTHITVFESSLYRTTSTLIDLGRDLIVVDPNWLPVEVQFISKWVNDHYPQHQLYLFFTHSDFDHIMGYQAFPNAKVLASQALVQNPNKESILQQIVDFDHEYYITRPYPILYPEVDIVVPEHDFSIYINEIEILFFKAQGHVSDGLFMIIPALHLWVAGDYLSNIEIPFIDHDYHAYWDTITTAAILFDQFDDIHILIPGHGDVATERTEIKDRISKDKRYLELLKKEDVEHPSLDALALIRSYQNNPNLIKAHQKNIMSLK